MKTHLASLIGCCIIFAANAGFAAEPASASTMQSLARTFEGDWTLKVRFEPSAESKQGLEGTGRETWHASPANLVITEEESINAGPIKMLIAGLFWTDQVTHTLHALDCNNQNPHVCGVADAIDGVRVHWDEKELVVEENEAGPNGEKMISRIVWSDITPSSFTETGYIGPPGGPFKKGMTLLATKNEQR